METRALPQPVRLRSAANTGTSIGTLVGYAYKVNALSEDLGGFVEHIEPGAGVDALRNSDVRALVDHNESKLIGRVSAGTLRVHEDVIGARYEVDIPDTSVGRDLAESLRRGDLTGSSFAFRTAPGGDKWSVVDDGRVVRTITRLSFVRDVSPCTFPAYPQTEAALRSLSAARHIPVQYLQEAARRGRLAEAASTRPIRRHAARFVY